ncbi:MAG TPA: GlsB/YeaQ/YmgE family stress response membrane protein [Anaerolineaceae bacterium]|jgi:uncharacterized membrane protein YeaQ/YmgE (transglycosylase-associated protein family)|nr:GlsB/YeaQ/YmgE family stress response membrane protein [Anaerolineaceae bacterium]HQN68628.1 hypothetical protein [Anaerolineaceae bacterium]
MFELNPWIQMILVGAIVGFITDTAMKGYKFKFLGAAVAGIVGAYLANVLIKEWGISLSFIPAPWNAILISAIGAGGLVAILRSIRQSS